MRYTRGQLTNHAGHVRVEYKALSVTGFPIIGDYHTFDFAHCMATLQPYPETVWPAGKCVNSYSPDFYNDQTDLLRECDVVGQPNAWIIRGSMGGKTSGNGNLSFRLRNYTTETNTIGAVTVSAATTSCDFQVQLVTMATDETLAPDSGWQLQVASSFIDNGMWVAVGSIDRISYATDYL